MRLRSILITLTMLICSCLFLFSQGIAAVSSETLKALSDKIDRWDVEEAWSEVNSLLAKDPRDPKLLELASQSAFYRGDYQESLKLMKSALELEEEEKRKGFVLFLEGTIGATQPLKRYESPHFRSASMRNRMGSSPITSSTAWRRPIVSWQSIMVLPPRKRSGSRFFPIRRHSTMRHPSRHGTLRLQEP